MVRKSSFYNVHFILLMRSNDKYVLSKNENKSNQHFFPLSLFMIGQKKTKDSTYRYPQIP